MFKNYLLYRTHRLLINISDIEIDIFIHSPKLILFLKNIYFNNENQNLVLLGRNIYAWYFIKYLPKKDIIYSINYKKNVIVSQYICETMS